MAMKSASQRFTDPASGGANPVVVGVEIGPAIIRAGVFTTGGHALLGKTKISTKLERGPEIVVERIARCIRYAVDECDLEMEQVSRIGVAAPGQILGDAVVASSPDLGWENVPLQTRLAARFDLPIAVGQLYNVAALGILAAELQHPVQRFAAVFVGPQIGAGVRIGGQWQELSALRTPDAGEQQLRSHIIAAQSHPVFGGFRGRDFRKALKKSENIAMREYVGRLAGLAGEAAARLHQAFALETIVLGGALMDEMKEEILTKARAAFEHRSPRGSQNSCALLASDLGDLAPITGAAIWATHRCADLAAGLVTSA